MCASSYASMFLNVLQLTNIVAYLGRGAILAGGRYED
jgi:hypothetical protein